MRLGNPLLSRFAGTSPEASPTLPAAIDDVQATSGLAAASEVPCIGSAIVNEVAEIRDSDVEPVWKAEDWEAAASPQKWVSPLEWWKARQRRRLPLPLNGPLSGSSNVSGGSSVFAPDCM